MKTGTSRQAVYMALLLISILALGSCKQKPELKGFDAQTWKNDHNGCDGKRVGLMPALDSLKPLLKGLLEMDIVDILGHPNRNELGDRHTKMYVYYVSGGKYCGRAGEIAKVLVIDFDALNRASLLSIRVE